MGRIGYRWLLLFLALMGNSCREDEVFMNNAQGNFEALWTILDERYCFFDLKDIDWQEVKEHYQYRLIGITSTETFFNLMGEMLAELKDGHVNLISAFDVSRYEAWFDDYPENFDGKIVDEKYLGKRYQIAAGMKYTIIQDSIGYIYYGNFSNGVGEGNLQAIFYKFRHCKGLILDVRNNGGGNLSNVEKIVSRFTQEKTLVGYTSYKTGKGHNDFSKPRPTYAEPSEYEIFTRPVVVLTNRSCYSATNDFVNRMRYMPQVVTMGDKTGGGGGFPFTSEIPIGWSVRFSAAPTYDRDMQHIEEGIEPDVKVELLPEDVAKGEDTIIEAAIRNILKRSEGNNVGKRVGGI
ncbi:MAG: S41 family peptidase [Bacteroidales bacterium]|nr:S41 family peptidase [Bacteroidales bacterium]